jgi:hypothetical protein
MLCLYPPNTLISYKHSLNILIFSHYSATPCPSQHININWTFIQLPSTLCLFKRYIIATHWKYPWSLQTTLHLANITTLSHYLSTVHSSQILLFCKTCYGYCNMLREYHHFPTVPDISHYSRNLSIVQIYTYTKIFPSRNQLTTISTSKILMK